ncbi:MAG TPA: hypothetical protein VFM02_00415 [Candidatus Paceibacterota bacterium]|nr:hypothetical protein [Candidatus Paceibacterota bacterium]
MATSGSSTMGEYQNSAELTRADRLRARVREKKQIEAQLLPKKMTGPAFYLFLGLCLLKDGLDVLINITIIFSLLTIPVAILIEGLVFMYLVISGIKLNTRNLTLWGLNTLIESIPFLNILPMFTVTFLLTKHYANKEVKEKNKEILAAAQQASRLNRRRGR